jgi:hyperosmotically inducible protein
MNTRLCLLPLALAVALVLSGCGAALVGGAGYTGYKGATDERSIGTIVDDSVISTSVKTKMISDEFVKARHIDVDVLNGVVYLIGVVESASQKRMAGDIARSVDGVRRVENQLVVGRTTAGQYVNDTILSSKIRTELLKDPDIRSTNVDVDTNNNIVTLTGIISTVSEKNRVLAIVARVAGNRQVIDNISVKN